MKKNKNEPPASPNIWIVLAFLVFLAYTLWFLATDQLLIGFIFAYFTYIMLKSLSRN